MNFIFNNKLAIFLIFLIFYCLFNYHLQEGNTGQIKIDRETGQSKPATEKDIESQKKLQEGMKKLQREASDKHGLTMEEAQKAADAAKLLSEKKEKDEQEKKKVQEAAEKELKHDREAALSAKTPTEQKKATEGSALQRMVESIDGETGQNMEKKAASEMSKLLDKKKGESAPEADTGARAKALGARDEGDEGDEDNKTALKMEEEAEQRIQKMAESLKEKVFPDIAKLQNNAIEKLKASNTQSKNIEKKLSGVAKSYGLASQGKGFQGVKGNQRSGFTGKSRKWNPKELIKQRDRVAARFGCQERCKYLYDDETDFLCDSGSCICKINRDKKKLLRLPGSLYKKAKQKKEGFTPKYVYRIHGKCDTTEINRGEA